MYRLPSYRWWSPSLLLLVLTKDWVTASNEAFIYIRNGSGESLQVSWINPRTQEKSAVLAIEKDGVSMMNSFAGHSFEAVEQPSSDSGSCSDGTCKSLSFSVVRPGDQYFEITADWTMAALEQTPTNTENGTQPNSQGAETISDCRDIAREQLEKEQGGDADSIVTELGNCLKDVSSTKLKWVQDEIKFQKGLRQEVASLMENVTCADRDLHTTPDIEQRHWTSDKDGRTRLVHVKLDRPASKIHVIEDFADGEECLAMEEAAASRLRNASTADGKGGSKLSENRKALQAGISPNWEKESDGDLITRLSRRVYDYSNHVLGMSLEEHGQEPLMSIQYNGRGDNDIRPDRYTPHCDGNCEGLPHRSGSRMATMVIYCTLPEKGGFTNFQRAYVHVKPSLGSAIFFSYIDPATKLMDDGFTLHSGCPVYEGTKNIVTQWLRYGVNSTISHNSFNTLGILKSESGE